MAVAAWVAISTIDRAFRIRLDSGFNQISNRAPFWGAFLLPCLFACSLLENEPSLFFGGGGGERKIQSAFILALDWKEFATIGMA